MRLMDIAKAVLMLGLTGYGGPAIVAQIKKKFVNQKAWVTEENFMNSLSLAQILPGATVVGMLGYFGYKMRGAKGWIVASAFYIFPAFVLTTFFATLYFRYGNLPLIQNLFVGLGALVVGLLVNAMYQLGHAVFGKISSNDYKGMCIAITTFALSMLTHIHVFFIILTSGLLGIVFYYFTHEFEGASVPTSRTLVQKKSRFYISKDSILLISGTVILAALVYTTHSIFWQISSTFFQIGSLGFGGGFTTLPLIKNIIVDEYKWLTLAQFRDGIAIGQITPGPIFITAAFIGYKIAGWLGAFAATVSVFLPSLLLMVIFGKFHGFIKHHAIVKVVVKGFLSGFIGVIAAIAFHFGQTSLINWQTWSIFVGTVVFVVGFKKDPVWAVISTIILSMIIL